MITFTCDACAKSYGVPDQYAGRRIKCPNCGEAARVPTAEIDQDTSMSLADPADTDATAADDGLGAPEQSAAMQDDASIGSAPERQPSATAGGAVGGACPSCGYAYNPGAKICIKCGRHLATGINAKTIAAGKKAGTLAGKAGLAMAASGVAAIVGGVVWAVVAVKANHELGILAWGIGLLAGGGIIAFTKERSARLGVAAVAFALLGLVIGKVLSVQWITSSDLAMEELLADDDFVLNATLYFMVENGEFSDDVIAQWDAVPVGEMMPPELEAHMVELASQRMLTMTDDERKLVTRSLLGVLTQQAPWTEKLTAALGLHDILWTILAVASAWGLATRGGEEAT